MNVLVFSLYLGSEHDDLVQVRVTAESVAEAESKVKSLLRDFVDTSLTGLFLQDYYEAD